MSNIHKGNFFTIQHEVFDCDRFIDEMGLVKCLNDLNKSAILMYIYLLHLANRFSKPDFFYTDKKFSEEIGLSRQSLSRARKELEEMGLINFISGNSGKATTYYVTIFKRDVTCCASSKIVT